MRPSRLNARIPAAFTLIELMVVITLVAILSAVLIPEMRGSFEGALLRGASRKFIDLFGLANGRAVALQQTHRIRLNRVTGRFVLERQTSQTRRATGFVPVRELSGSEGMIDHRIAFELRPTGAAAADPNPSLPRREPAMTPPTDTLNFYPDGTADAAELTLRDQAGFRVLLRLNPTTARVRVSSLSRP